MLGTSLAFSANHTKAMDPLCTCPCISDQALLQPDAVVQNDAILQLPPVRCARGKQLVTLQNSGWRAVPRKRVLTLDTVLRLLE